MKKKITKYAVPSNEVVRVTAAESKRMGRIVYSGVESPVHEVSDRHHHLGGWEKYGVTNVKTLRYANF